MGNEPLLVVRNRHPDARPEVSEAPGRYLGYFENEDGEQLIFVHDQGQPTATLYHLDLDWRGFTVREADSLPADLPEAERKLNEVIGMGNPSTVGIILASAERQWLLACWAAIAYRRDNAMASDE